MLIGKCDFCGFIIKLPKERFRTAFYYHRVNGKYCLGNAVRKVMKDPVKLLQAHSKAQLEIQLFDLQTMVSNIQSIPDHVDWMKDFEEKALKAEKIDSMLSFFEKLSLKKQNE